MNPEIPERKCKYYDPDTSETCSCKASYIVSFDYGYPGDFGVLSSYMCEEHKYTNGVQSIVPWEEWFVKNILKPTEQATEWDLT